MTLHRVLVASSLIASSEAYSLLTTPRVTTPRSSNSIVMDFDQFKIDTPQSTVTWKGHGTGLKQEKKAFTSTEEAFKYGGAPTGTVALLGNNGASPKKTPQVLSSAEEAFKFGGAPTGTVPLLGNNGASPTFKENEFEFVGPQGSIHWKGHGTGLKQEKKVFTSTEEAFKYGGAPTGTVALLGNNGASPKKTPQVLSSAEEAFKFGGAPTGTVGLAGAKRTTVAGVVQPVKQVAAAAPAPAPAKAPEPKPEPKPEPEPEPEVAQAAAPTKSKKSKSKK